MLWLVAAIGIGVVALAHTAPLPFLLEWMGPDRSVWHVPREDGRPAIYLTYDDGPNPAATPALLDVLAREQARATFFIIPRHVTPETAPILRRMIERRGIHPEPHLPAHHLGISVREPEQRARVVAFDIDDRLAAARAGASAHVTRQRCVDTKLSIQGKVPDDASAAHETQIKSPQRLSVEARDCTDFDVEVDVRNPL